MQYKKFSTVGKGRPSPRQLGLFPWWKTWISSWHSQDEKRFLGNLFPKSDYGLLDYYSPTDT